MRLCAALASFVVAVNAAGINCGVDMANVYQRTSNLGSAKTVESWVKVTTNQPWAGPAWVGSSFYTDKAWGLYLGKDKVYSAQHGGPSFAYGAGESPVDGTWHHVAVVGGGGNTDKYGGNARMYVDGVFSNNVNNFFDQTGDAWIGAYPDRFQCCGMGGSIEMKDVRFWSAERTQDQIRDNMNTLGSTQGLLSRITFSGTDTEGAVTIAGVATIDWVGTTPSALTCAAPQGPYCYCQGDPHCKTFDKKKYDWYGPCDYTFLKDARSASSGFEVQVRNSDKARNGATMIQQARVKLPGGDVLSLVRDPNCITYMQPFYYPGQSEGWPGKINGAQLQIPYSTAHYSIEFLPNDKPDFVGWNANGKGIGITIPSLGVKLVWTTCFKIAAYLDGDSPLLSSTVGMCANADGNAGNDMPIVQDKCYHQVTTADSLFESQKAGCPAAPCDDPPPPFTPCTTPAAVEVCGCFDKMSACFDKVPVEEVREACFVDACAMEGHEQMAEGSCDAYAEECCEAGVPVGNGCPPWFPTTLTKAPTFAVLTQAPKKDQGFEIPPDVSGDPFTTYKGRRTQFWLPLNQKTMLIKSEVGVALFAGVMPSGIEGDSQQWFNAIDVRVNGRNIISIGLQPNASTADMTDMDDVSVVMPPKHIFAGIKRALEILMITIDGAVVRHTVAARQVADILKVNVGKQATEIIEVESPGLTVRVQSAQATKFASEQKAMKYMHLDLGFVTIANATACAGVLPEVWGVKPVSAETAKFLVPPTN